MTKIGRIALCNSCHEEKTIAAEFSSETSGRETLYCRQCYRERNNCFCDICGQRLSVTFYSKHLDENHTKEELVKALYNLKYKSAYE